MDQWCGNTTFNGDFINQKINNQTQFGNDQLLVNECQFYLNPQQSIQKSYVLTSKINNTSITFLSNHSRESTTIFLCQSLLIITSYQGIINIYDLEFVIFYVPLINVIHENTKFDIIISQSQLIINNNNGSIINIPTNDNKHFSQPISITFKL